MMKGTIKISLFVVFTMLLGHLSAQNTNQVKLDQMIEKKAEYQAYKWRNGWLPY